MFLCGEIVKHIYKIQHIMLLLTCSSNFNSYCSGTAKVNDSSGIILWFFIYWDYTKMFENSEIFLYNKFNQQLTIQVKLVSYSNTNHIWIDIHDFVRVCGRIQGQYPHYTYVTYMHQKILALIPTHITYLLHSTE